MLILDFLSWWYGRGLVKLWQRLEIRLLKLVDYFSISILLKTLFQPFKLISSYQTGRDLASKWSAFVDKTISRMIGFVIRSVTLLTGLISITIALIYFLLSLLAWLTLPFLPVVLIILFALEIRLW